MPWHTPHTFFPGDVLTATEMNEISDDLNFLHDGTVTGPGTTLPGSPINGQEYIWQAAVGTNWIYRYNSASASAYKWEFIGGSSLTLAVETSQSTSSATYADLATVGPTTVLARAGDYLISWGAVGQPDVANGTSCFISIDFSSSGAASDATCIQSNLTGGADTISGTRLYLARTAGETCKLKYRTDTLSGMSYSRRFLSVQPVRVA